MSARVRSRSRGRRDDQETSGSIKPVTVLKNTDKSSQEKPPPTKSQDIEIGQEEEEEEGGIIVVEIEDDELDFDCLGMSMESTVFVGEDAPDMEEKIPPNLECAKIPETGDMQS